MTDHFRTVIRAVDDAHLERLAAESRKKGAGAGSGKGRRTKKGGLGRG